MEARVFQYTLQQFIQNKPAVIRLQGISIKESDLIELFYTYVHSKSLILLEILNRAVDCYDLIIFLDLSLSIDLTQVNSTKILIYRAFSAPEMAMYLKSFESLLLDCKVKTLIVIDSWTSYLWSDKLKEKSLESLIDKASWSCVLGLVEKFGATVVVCRKSSVSVEIEARSEEGSFFLVSFEKREKVTRVLLVLEPLIIQDSLIHAICDQTEMTLNTFTYPFSWRSSTKL